jgi:hypothetical protein
MEREKENEQVREHGKGLLSRSVRVRASDQEPTGSNRSINRNQTAIHRRLKLISLIIGIRRLQREQVSNVQTCFNRSES